MDRRILFTINLELIVRGPLFFQKISVLLVKFNAFLYILDVIDMLFGMIDVL